MIDRLHELADRPIADRERRRLFALGAAVVAVAAGAMAVLPDPLDEPAGPARTNGEHQWPRPPFAEVDVELSGPSAEVELAARRFLTGYLRFIYGQRSARTIAGVTPRLRRAIVRSRVRVPPAAQHGRPRILSVKAQPTTGASRFAVGADIADGGVARYPIELVIARTRAGLRVVEVSGH